MIQFFSLLSACILCLRPFLESLTSGFLNGDDLRRRGQDRPYILMPDSAAVGQALKAECTSTTHSGTQSLETKRNARERKMEEEKDRHTLLAKREEELTKSTASAGEGQTSILRSLREEPLQEEYEMKPR
jgi:hypothetical protein